jgi:hypothetical protein
MPGILKATAYANNEVAFLAWRVDGPITGCLGFEVMREYLDDADQVTETVPLAAYVAFKGQSNPDWRPQNTSVWPIQKYSWRDLTLRKKRDGAQRRPDEVRVRYAIRPVGRMAPGLTPVEPRVERTKGVANTFKGEALALGYLGDAERTAPVLVTRRRGSFESSFTNGILSGQWLVRALKEGDGKIADGELKQHLTAPGDRLRNYLAGDVLPLLHDFFGRPDGRFRMALYELDDQELEQIVTDNAARIDLVLSNTGPGDDDDDKATPEAWDARNRPARQRLTALAGATPGFGLQHRMFNNAVQIGHNKFAVWLDADGVPRSVVTGSTNWTWTGIAGQSNNCVRIDDPAVAAAFSAYWERLHADAIPLPVPPGAPMSRSAQGQAFRESNRAPAQVALAEGGTAEIWFSPNMRPRKYPANPDTPPDLQRLFSLMRRARQAVLFAVFYPSMQGRNSIVAEAVNMGVNDSSLLVLGAVSAPQAMFNFKAGTKLPDGSKLPDEAPFTFRKNRVSVVRAAALTDKGAMAPFGDFQREILRAGNAIIHDKVLVIDPLDPVNCAVAFGSHNLGFKASYSNDENLVIVEGQQALAQAYAVHVLDVYDHYRFRAAEAELSAEGKEGFEGFLATDDRWQDHAGTDISNYFAA